MNENGLGSDSNKIKFQFGGGGGINIYFSKTVFLKYCL